MICLTGDIHHATLNTGNQQHSDISEIQTAALYTRLVEEFGVKVTYFITGKSFADEWEDLRPVCQSPNVEIGGHTYDAFEPQLWHRVWNKLINSYNGPYWYQKRDAEKTIEIIRQKTGKTITMWRNHMYMHGKYTEKVLASCGIRVCSDGVKKDSTGMEWHPAGIYNYPINIIPDHEHLIHAERTPQWIEAWIARYNWSDDYGSQSYYIDEWAELVLAGLQEREARGITSNLIIHPITMYLCDNFEAVKRILEYIATRENCFMSELYEAEAARGDGHEN
jgi:peptidoglycan/xylan/chitin deacetylase (PgdA/CDA1 family)